MHRADIGVRVVEFQVGQEGEQLPGAPASSGPRVEGHASAIADSAGARVQSSEVHELPQLLLTFSTAQKRESPGRSALAALTESSKKKRRQIPFLFQEIDPRMDRLRTPRRYLVTRMPGQLSMPYTTTRFSLQENVL
jgi:hypothetical protein